MKQASVKRGRISVRRRGLTLVELMLTVTVVAVLMAIAVPSMQQLIARKRVAGVASELVSDLRYLRSLGMQSARPVQVDFGSDASATCYSLSTIPYSQADCDCTDTSTCNGSEGAPKIVKTVSLTRSEGVLVSADRANTVFAGSSSLPVDAVTNQIATIKATVTSTSTGGTVRVWTNSSGRPFACSASGQESNFPDCCTHYRPETGVPGCQGSTSP